MNLESSRVPTDSRSDLSVWLSVLRLQLITAKCELPVARQVVYKGAIATAMMILGENVSALVSLCVSVHQPTKSV